MASRQNKEARKEYPTGHNKGNDSPDRDVLQSTPPRTFGAPTSIPPVVDDTAAREALLATTGEGGTASEHIEADRQGRVDETEARERAEAEAASRAQIPDDTDGDTT